MLNPQFILCLAAELIVDLFAGGGGMSTGIERGIGRHADYAINHNANALSQHQVNHPQTKHLIADVREINPRHVAEGRPVGLLHLSPDCTHHSQAKGGQPRDAKMRALSWVGVHWAGTVRPRIITLENVKQIQQWGPLIAKRCPLTKRVVKIDGTVGALGEHVPLQQQFLVPDPKRAGQTWRRFVAILRGMGYDVDARVLRASDFDTPTTRARLFMVARCDGVPITWATPTHHQAPARGQQAWRPALDAIDLSIPSKSIFDRPKPLVDATLTRIAHGLVKHVLASGDPCIIPITHKGRPGRTHDIRLPMPTITTSKGGELALVATTLVQMGYGERPGQAPRALDLRKPLGTVVAGGLKHGLVTGTMVQVNGGFNATPAHDLRAPLSTVTKSGSQQQLATALLAEPDLSPEQEAGALRCAAFLMRYHGTGGQWSDLREPMTTVTTRDRIALVTVWIQGDPWVIVDIQLRMLTPRELYNANGFPPDYIIDRGHDGRRFSKSQQVRMVGNSVPPTLAEAFISEIWHARVPERMAA